MPFEFPRATTDGGIPRVEAYERLLAGDAFRDLERFSDAFLAQHGDALAPYARRWVADPLHQWSRQWEYPWVHAALEELKNAEPGRPLQLLDAGSGATFFPFFVASRLPGATVRCCDQDTSLGPIYSSLASGNSSRVEFVPGTLSGLEFPPDSFDAVYCISVLEHTRDYERILDGFAQVLRPGGRLVLTFDVSLDGRSELAPAEARRLLDAADRRFEAVDAPSPGAFERALGDPGLLTTATFRERRPELLPWRADWRSGVAQLLRGKAPGPPFYLCTIVCGVWRRRGKKH